MKKKNLGRLIAVAGAVAIAAGTLTACGSNSGSTNETTTVAETESTTVVETTEANSTDKKAELEKLAKFKDDHPELKNVMHELYGAMDKSLETNMNAAYTKTQERFKTDSALMKEILGTSDEKVNEITETLSLAVEAFNTDIRVTQNMIYNDDTDDAGKTTEGKSTSEQREKMKSDINAIISDQESSKYLTKFNMIFREEMASAFVNIRKERQDEFTKIFDANNISEDVREEIGTHIRDNIKLLNSEISLMFLANAPELPDDEGQAVDDINKFKEEHADLKPVMDELVALMDTELKAEMPNAQKAINDDVDEILKKAAERNNASEETTKKVNDYISDIFKKLDSDVKKSQGMLKAEVFGEAAEAVEVAEVLTVADFIRANSDAEALLDDFMHVLNIVIKKNLMSYYSTVDSKIMAGTKDIFEKNNVSKEDRLAIINLLERTLLNINMDVMEVLTDAE